MKLGLPRRYRFVVGGLCGAALIALLALPVLASIPGPGGVINGCFQRSTGKLRVIDPSSTKPSLRACHPDEVAIHWSQTGPPGPPGPPGPGHFQQLTFTIAPGGSQSFMLPAKQAPVRIEVTFSLLNGGTQTPSEIMYAVVNQDPSSSQMTWVGTNNDGTQSGATSISATEIAHIFGGASPTVNATLAVDSLTMGTLKITQNATTTILSGHYIVDLWF